ncbi:hypothetical protein DMA11_18465 [Marinilabiliaceae bacterium JC017]|nr:hypothetical protein DMA11_18465 [Marinilabiliaceae bacterium JC017]
MKNLICLITASLLLFACDKKENETIILPSEPSIEMKFLLNNIGNKTIPLTEIEGAIHYPNEKNITTIHTNEYDLEPNRDLKVTINKNNGIQPYEKCKVWFIVHVREAISDTTFYESIWLTNKHYISKDTCTQQITFNWPSDTLTTTNVSRKIKKGLQDIYKIYDNYSTY